MRAILKYRKALRFYFFIKYFFTQMYEVFAIRSIFSIFTDDAHYIINKNVCSNQFLKKQ